MAAGSIVIDLLMRTGAFETDTKRAEKRLNELKKEAQAVGTAIGAAFAGVGIAAAALVKSSIDAMDQMSKLAQQVGTTVENLSALSYAADMAGVNQEQLGSALVKLTKNMSDAANGSGEAVKGFDALGISVKRADGSLKGSDEVLGEVAAKFAGFADGAEKTALAVNLFGKSGAQLIPLLNSGAEGIEAMKSEAEQLGLVLDTDTSRAAEEFNDNLSRMAAAVSGVANRAAGELLPALTQVSTTFVDLAKSQAFVETTSGLVKAAVGGLITVFQTVATVGSDVGFVFMSVGREIGAWAAQLAAVASGDLRGFTAISDAVKEDGRRARAELDAFQARVMAIGSSSPAGYTDPRLLGDPGSIASQTAGWGKASAPRMAGDEKKATSRISEFQKYLDSLQRQVEKTQELTAAEQVLLDISTGRAGKTTAAQKDILLGLAQQIDDAKELELDEKSREESARRLAAAQKQVAQEAAAIYEATRTPLERYQAGMERLQELYDAGHIKDVETYTRATKLLGDEFVQSGEKTKEAIDQFTEFAKQAERNIQDALGSTLEQTMAGNFESIGQMWIQLIQKMAAQALAARLNEALFGSGGSGGGLLSGLAKAFIGGASGGSTGTFQSGSYSGGIDGTAFLATGTNYIPYDNFPAILHKGEAVVPAKYNPAAGGAGGAGKVDMSGQTIYIGQGVSRGEVTAAIEAGNARIKADIMRSLQQRGV
jgi:hypothetical protein